MLDTKIMSKVESVILGMFFGLLPLVFCLLITLIMTDILFGTEVFGPWFLLSLAPGIIIDCLFLKKWVRKAYQINTKALTVIYLFYSVVALGMGMGVPIFNFALGITAGIYAARRTHFAGSDEERRKQYFKKTAVFSAVVMVLMCCLIMLWAIAGQMIGYRFETPWCRYFLRWSLPAGPWWFCCNTGLPAQRRGLLLSCGGDRSRRTEE
ncbi:MAG: hypothetical protein ACYS30_23640 [Planctomycetota bacterium]|jgi:hypothetical protein